LVSVIMPLFQNLFAAKKKCANLTAGMKNVHGSNGELLGDTVT